MAQLYERPHFFDRLQYQVEVLQLANSTAEDDLDEQIRSKAQAIGINLNRVSQHTPLPSNDPQPSIWSSAASEQLHVSSTYSTNSRNSFSTDIASEQSHSADRRRSRIFSLPLRSFSRLSISNSINDSGKSFVSTCDSVSSVSLSRQSLRSSGSFAPSHGSSLRKSSKVKKHLGLSKFRKSNQQDEEPEPVNVCFRCLQLSSLTPAPPAYKLQCGHEFCHDHLLHIMRERGLGIETALTRCCFRQTCQSAMSSLTPSRTNDPSVFSTRTHSLKFGDQPTLKIKARAQLDGHIHASHGWGIKALPSMDCERNFQLAFCNPDFQQMRQEQGAILDRFEKFQEKSRRLLSDHHTKYRFERLSEQNQVLSDLHEAHMQLLGKLEDKHVLEEIELRIMHDQEQNNCALALRHMEAYMRLHDPDGSGGDVTEQDKKELQKQYWLRDNMETRHQSGINVLREQQHRVSRTRRGLQEKEFALLQLKHQREVSQLDRTFETEVQEFGELSAQRRCRLLARFGLQDEIWRRQHNEEMYTITTTTNEENRKQPQDLNSTITHVPFPIPPITCSADLHNGQNDSNQNAL